MKLQHLAIIFVIIIVPISIVLSEYITVQSNTIKRQVAYDASLINSTYDAVKAFELNEINNNYSTINNSKIRDITASISTFYKSLATNFNSENYTENELKEYIPAILFTLYDGYYIYSKYEDTVTGEYVYGLKPLMYYSCRYVTSADDFVVNYTLDNSISVIGKVNHEYVNKTGYLIVLTSIPMDLSNINSEQDLENIAEKAMNSGNKEIVTENLKFVNDDGTTSQDQYEYLTYNGQKIYKENGINNTTDNRTRYFYYSTEYKKDFVNNNDMLNYINKHFDGTHLYNTSAYEYYARAKVFTNWVNSNLNNITQSNAKDADGNAVQFATNTREEKIFETGTNNNPLRTDSTFNENRISVIRKSIETSLITAIQTFSNRSSTQYSFSMPELSETEWYNIENNIAMVTFMQGLPTIGKVYNNYCVVSNNTNKEMIGAESLYVIDSNNEYHRPGCKKLMDNLNSGAISIKGMYSSVEFKRKSISVTGADSNAHGQLTGSNEANYQHYYKHSDGNNPYTACYECIVTFADTYNIDDVISGKEITYGDSKKINYSNLNGYNYSQAFLKALARERYDIYITNGYLINN